MIVVLFRKRVCWKVRKELFFCEKEGQRPKERKQLQDHLSGEETPLNIFDYQLLNEGMSNRITL